MHALLVSALLILCPSPQDGKATDPAPPEKAEPEKADVSPPETAVIAAVARAAKVNGALPLKKRKKGDSLFDHYVRAAATAADGDAKAFLVGLAISVDPDGSLNRSPFVGHLFRGKETKEAATERQRDLGKPTLRGRGDLMRHFTVSAALAVLMTEDFSTQAGTMKENSDMRVGTGYSFKDMLANLSGIRLALWLQGKGGGKRLSRVAELFKGTAHMPDPADEPEGLDREQYLKHVKEASGSIADKLEEMREVIAAQAVYRAKKVEVDAAK